MTATTKTVTVNYTAEQTAEMVSAYSAKPEKATVEMLAAKLGKTVKSVVAKLVREKVYVKPVAVSKNGLPVVKKSELVDQLSALVPMTEAEATSFEHVNKTALLKLLAALLDTVEAETESDSEFESRMMGE